MKKRSMIKVRARAAKAGDDNTRTLYMLAISTLLTIAIIGVASAAAV